VFHGGDLQFYLSAAVPLKRSAELLRTLNVRRDQIVSVIDRNGVFVARSVKQDEFAGTHRSLPYPTDSQGVVHGVNREGVPFHSFYRHSDLLGWDITTAVLDSVLDAPMNRALRVVGAGGGLLWVLATFLVHFWGGQFSQWSGALGIDRKPTREEFEILFDSAPNGVMVVDNQGRIAMLNAQMEKKFAYLPGELIGKPLETLVPDRHRSAHSELRQAFGINPLSRPMGAGRDPFGRRKDGTEFPVEITLNPINSRSGSLTMITVVDVSARKLAAERLAATMAERDDLRRRFIQAQEQERLRLAHELHDQTGQGLTAAMLEIKAIENSVNEPNRTRLRLLGLQLSQIGQTLHHIAWELRPASIDELGLASALANYVTEWSGQYGIGADFHSVGLTADGFSDEICTTIYRVVQEALTNVVKHAREATNVSVIIEQIEEKVRLTIEDDGCGFDVGSSSEPGSYGNKGIGIAGMRERLILIGAEFEVESSIGIGTTIFARIPV
jgi:PAS domain S-box-containing protein